MNRLRARIGPAVLVLAWMPAATVLADEGAIDAAENLSRVALGLVAVLVLIFGLAWAVRRFSFLNVLQRDTNSPIRAIGQLSVGPKERVMLIEVEGRRMVIGVAPGRITRLDPLDGDSGEAGKDFAAHLQASREARKK